MEKMSCYIPNTLKEALEILNTYECTVLAGGSDLMVQNKRTIGVDPVFDKPVLIIRNLKELKGISLNSKGECVIGAACTSSEIANNNLCPWHLRQAASRMGAVGLRNSATIGGNICNASPKGDTPGPLYLLDARVKVESVEGFREILVKDFIKGYKKLDLNQNEIVTEVIIPLSEDDFDYVFWHKVGTRRANAISKITVSQAIKFDVNGIVSDYRLSSTASGAITNRSREVEELIIGKQINNETISQITEGFDKVISPRAMPEFRRESVKRMICRFLSVANSGPAEKVIDTYDDYKMPGSPQIRENRK